MYRRNLAAACLMTLALFATGCDDEGIGFVEGSVTIDGEPAPEGLMITFDPAEQGLRESTADTDENGNYVALFSIQREGVYKGDCVARLTTPDEGLPMEGEELHLKYPDKYYVELKAFTVEAGMNKVDFEISTEE